MVRFLGVLFLCLMFLTSHLGEISLCGNNVDSLDHLTQMGHQDVHETQDCDFSCHHCHHIVNLTVINFSYQLGELGQVSFTFTPDKPTYFQFGLLRPPAFS